MNKRPDVHNLLVKGTCYAKDELPITGFVNAIFQLPLIVSYNFNKKNYKPTNFFNTLINKCVGENVYSYKKDNIQLSDDVFQSGLLNILSQSLNK